MIRSRDRRADPGVGHRNPDDEAVFPEEHGSPGWAAIARTLNPESGCRILDLGPAVPANIRFYGEFASHVRVVDGVRDLAALVETEEEEGEFETVLDQIWRGVEGKFDVVMAWDLVSHIEPKVARSVISRLHAVCRQGAKLFMMTYAGATMPSLPQVFEIRSADRLLYRPASSDLVSAGVLAPAEVERLLRGFRVESSFLLRHGVREYAATRM